MIQYNIFPGGKRRIITFSYDDGSKNDLRLAELFRNYNVKASFHLNGRNYLNMSDSELKEIGKWYEGHEISCHTVHHGFVEHMALQSVVSEITEERKILEKMAGYPVIGMSYPFGSYSEKVIAACKSCGMVYSRTGASTRDFALPIDFMQWHPTCHHNEALELWNSRFKPDMNIPWRRPLFYIFGHSHELVTPEHWEYMETLLKEVSGHDEVWYATSMEIYNYFQALYSLQITVDEKIIYNPSNTTVWVEKDLKDIICIRPGEVVYL